jgi:AcrR family transcriptional regulator
VAFTDRSRASREAILAAARRRFTEHGYERTTIRLVAFDAGVDPSMVMRYYGSKDGLFAAAVETDLQLPNLSACDSADAADVLARHFMTLWRSGDGGSLTLLLRSAMTHEAAAEHLRSVFAEQVAPMVRTMLGASAESDVRAGLVSTQLLGFALTRYVLHLQPMVDIDDDEFIALTAATLRRILAEPVPPPPRARTRRGQRAARTVVRSDTPG